LSDNHHRGSLAAAARRAQAVAVERWVRDRLGTIGHEVRVAEIAANVFDITAGFHRLSRCRDGHLLRLSSLLHDVGRSVDDARHPAEGAAMILRDTTMPLAPVERRALAYLTLYHRGDVPAAGDDDVLHPEDNHGALLDLLALLRGADALDSRSLESPQVVFALRGSARQTELHVTCYLQTDSPKLRRVYRRRKKFRLLEERFDCRVVVDVQSAHDLRLVA
jgi:exopolyphosphatase/pppGpp-phosphohydrolase